MFFAPQNKPRNSPSTTTNSPQLHHKNTTQKTRIFQNHPQKRLQTSKKKPRQSPELFSCKI
jgi:hypothetical protein